MAVSGNKMAADIGGGGSAARNLAKKRLEISWNNGGKGTKHSDFMPSSVRKQANKVGSAAGRARAVGTNIDAILKTLTGKRLPKRAKRILNNPLTAATDTVATFDNVLRGRRK